jgi:hypothetical protein
MTFFIKLLEACFECKDFYSCFAIFAGLNFSSVARLKLTWAKIAKPIMLKYQKYMEMLDLTKNYKSYRDELARTVPPLVPYVGKFPFLSHQPSYFLLFLFPSSFVCKRPLCIGREQPQFH